MFGTIRKHQKWLWLIIITLTIVSFVAFFNPTQKVANKQSGEFYVGTIYNEPISRDQWYNGQREILLQYLFNTGTWYDEQEAKRQNFKLDERTFVRLMLIQKQEDLGIQVGSDMAAKVATQMLRQLERNNPISPEVFVERVLKPHNMGYEDFDRFVRHEVGVQEIISTMGVSGRIVTPGEVRDLYVRENQELATEVALFSASNYLSEVKATPEAVGQFYSNAIANYRLPERVQVEYVKFAFSNYFPKVEKELTNLNEIVESNYQKLGTNAFPEAKTPGEAKEKIRAEILRRQAAPLARKAANDFAQPLFDTNPPPLTEFANLAQTNGLKTEITEPFGRDETPKGLDVHADFSRVGFSLSENNLYSQPLMEQAGDGAYVLAFHKRLPSEIEPLDKIRDRVTMDYKLSQAMGLATKAGRDFYAKLTNGIVQGKTFDAVCAEEKIKPVELPHFSLLSRELPAIEDHLPFNYFQRIAFSTQPGKTGSFQQTRQGGMVLHVKTLVPVDETKMNSELPNFASLVRQTRQREIFDKWMAREFPKVITDAPALRQEREGQKAPRKTAKS